ncbi:MAG: hypothetical protein FJX76_26285, partial [Armatimonadetes bacterium]|nr:hypothetical protein [Armatimonadota bacterium]
RRDPDRALQCYNQAADLAERMHDPVYMQQACLGMGLIYLEQDQGDAARDVLERGRLCLGGTQGSARLWHALLAALCTWHQGQREDSWRMLELVIRTCREERESSCLALATGLSANLMLAWRGPDHPDFSSALDAFVEVVERHDVLDEVIRLRAQALPLLAEAIRQGVRAATARAIMTRLGEPLHDSFKPAAEAPRRTSVPMVAVSAPRVAEPEAQPLRVECFGNCTVAFGGRTIRTEDWPVQKAMRLFAMLVHKPEGVYDSALLGHFWPESDEERARASLRNALYYVRGILDDLGRDAGPGTVPEVHRSRRSRAISLRGDYWVDTVALESGVARAGDLFALERHEEARNALGVLSLYRGAFMEGVDDDWVQGPRTHYAEVYLKGMHLLARCHLAMGDAEAAEAVARRALVHDDLRETLHVALLEALLAQGRRAEAMRHYQDAAAHFEKEFGISVPRILTDLFPRLVA